VPGPGESELDRNGETLAESSGVKRKRRSSLSRVDRWWEEEDPCEELCAKVEALRKETNERHLRWQEWGDLYETGALTRRADRRGKKRVTNNVVRSVTDSIHARYAKAKPRAQFLTMAGNWREQRAGRLLTAYVTGVFKDSDIYTAMQAAARDSMIYEIGMVKVWPDHDAARIKAEHVDPFEVLVDEREARYGAPQSLYQYRTIARDQLMGMFPEHADKIENASQTAEPVDQRYGRQRNTIDALQVCEAWHLPSVTGAGDGRHVIAIRECTLLDEPWERPWFPFVVLRWADPLNSRHGSGWYGHSLVDELYQLQDEFTRITRHIQVGIARVAVPRVLCPAGAEVDNSQWTSEIGGVVTYKGGQPPMIVTGQAFGPEVYNYQNFLRQTMFEQSGQSQLSATSQKPAGLNSGAALMTYQDIESERFILQGQRYEAAFVEAAKIVVDMSRDLYAKNHDLSVKTKSGKFLRSIEWAKIDLDDSRFSIDVFPTSALPTTPEGKLQRISELEAKGYISREQALQLLDYPDLDAFMSTALAAQDEAYERIDRMLDSGVYEAPEPFDNLQLTMQTAQTAYLRRHDLGLSEEECDMLRQLMNDCASMLTPPEPPPGPPGPPGPAPGPGPEPMPPQPPPQQ